MLFRSDYDSIEHNPMGGIDGEFIVNKDKNLIVLFRLEIGRASCRERV